LLLGSLALVVSACSLEGSDSLTKGGQGANIKTDDDEPDASTSEPDGEGGTGGTSSNPFLGGSSGSAGSSSSQGGTAAVEDAGTPSTGGAAEDAGEPPEVLVFQPCVSQEAWEATADPTPPNNFLNIPNDQLKPPYAIDDSLGTRYSSGRAKSGDEWFKIDLGEEQLISGVQMIEDVVNDRANTYEIEVSVDDDTYTLVAEEAVGPADEEENIYFDAVWARYVRINQTSSSDGWWSLHEVNVQCEQGDAAAPVADGGG
jgi:hypothetical protein